MFGLIFERHVNKTDDTDLSDVVKEHISAQDDYSAKQKAASSK